MNQTFGKIWNSYDRGNLNIQRKVSKKFHHFLQFHNRVYNNQVYFLYFSGDFTLDIHPVDLDDDARFQCQIGAADGIKPIRSQYATLTVLVPPEPPKLMPTGDLMKTVEGRQVELRCESRGGKPASEVIFTIEINLHSWGCG